jgi:hypothetical protein
MERTIVLPRIIPVTKPKRGLRIGKARNIGGENGGQYATSISYAAHASKACPFNHNEMIQASKQRGLAENQSPRNIFSGRCYGPYESRPSSCKFLGGELTRYVPIQEGKSLPCTKYCR